MEQVFLVVTSGMNWGRGKSISEACNNAKLTFGERFVVTTLWKEDGSNFTDDEVKSIRTDGMRISYPTGAKYRDSAEINLSELDFLIDKNKLCCYVTEVLNDDEELRKNPNHNKITFEIAKRLESLGIDLY